MRTRLENTFSMPSLQRTSVGFDSMFRELERQFVNSASNGYPPYNIIHNSDDHYEIEMAVAGFSMDQISIVHEKNVLRIEGNPSDVNVDTTYLHKGIANRSFKREFTLANHVEVESASLLNGMLHVSLRRHVPEELQPKRIEIKQLA